ncbi:MAG: ATPase, T2SS/T4P/T4SS family [Polyangia bacterium]
MPEPITVEIRRGAEVLDQRELSDGASFVLGRSSSADVTLESREVSREHCGISCGAERFEVRDMSVNGVRCEGRRLEEREELPYGATIEIGPFEVRLLRRGDEGGAERALASRRRILQRLVHCVELEAVDRGGDSLRARVEAALERIAHDEGLSAGPQLERLISELADEALGLGPLERLMADDAVSEIMVVDPRTVYVERGGQLQRSELSFTSAESVRTVIERIITPLGRRVDESSPMVDARLPDGSRVNVVIPPLALRGPAITIRKFSRDPLGIEDLIRFGSLDRTVAGFLERAVAARRNVVISGGTGSGKTTLLNVLAGAIDPSERIVTIEDAAELQLPQPHVVRLESRPANAEGSGAVGIRDLVRNALRMRPDRIVVGECRGGEALDMLQAMNTGHDGSLTTTHANSPHEAISRLETLGLMAGLELPSRAIREQIAAAVDLVVQQTRFPDGARRITSIAEVVGMEEDGSVRLAEIFRYAPGREGDRSRQGEFMATGRLPSFAADISVVGGPEASS